MGEPVSHHADKNRDKCRAERTLGILVFAGVAKEGPGGLELVLAHIFEAPVGELRVRPPRRLRMKCGSWANVKPLPAAGGAVKAFEESLTLPNDRMQARNLVASEPLPLPAAGEVGEC